MATRKIILDQDNNEIFPITDTGAVKNPQAIGGTLESRLGTIEGKIPSTASSSNKLATSSDVSNKLNAPSQAGTNGQVLTSDGQGGQSWQDPQGGGVSDYDELLNKPTINNYELSGNKTSAQLGLQDQLVSGTTIKTFNGQSILGSGNIDTVNGYINANSVSDLNTNYPAASEFSAKIALVPSQTTSGSLDYYTCTSNNNTWSWVLAGTTAPIVSVQEVDTYQPLLILKTVGSYVGKTAGDFTTSSTLETVIYDISDAKKLVCDFTVINAGTLVLSFFDDSLDLNDLSTASSHYLGWRIDKNKPPYVVSENTQFKNQVINVDSDATLGSGDVTGARYVGLTRLVSNHFGGVSALTPVSQSLVKKQPIALNEILIFNTLIQLPQIWNSDTANATEITTQQTLSTWGVVFPSTYTNIGKPTQLIAMLHGLSGYVAEGVLGHSGAGWVASRQAYLDAGFAVLDINGYGTGDSDDQDSRPWGNPASVETLDKAFEYLKANYNVCDKLLIAGVSMGGILAMGYAKCFPGKVAAVGLFAPNLFAYSMRYLPSSDQQVPNSKEVAWGYADHSEAAGDNYSHLTGYVLLNKCNCVDNGTVKPYTWPSEKPSTWPANLADLELIEYFPIPMRVWQGTEDTSVNPNCSRLLVKSLRNGNSNVTLRMCLGAEHDVQNEQYVREEAVDWFKRYRGGSSDDGGGSYVDTGLPTGGTTGQVLVKKSNNSYDTEWVDLNNGYITADSIANRPTASEEYKSKICLVPASDNSGAMDQYVCVLNGSTWEWQLGGTTSPIVAVQKVDMIQGQPYVSITPNTALLTNGSTTDNQYVDLYEYDMPSGFGDCVYVTYKTTNSTQGSLYAYKEDGTFTYLLPVTGGTAIVHKDTKVDLPSGIVKIRINSSHVTSGEALPNPQCSLSALIHASDSVIKEQATPNQIIYGKVLIDTVFPLDITSDEELTTTRRYSGYGIMFPTTYSNIGNPTPVIAMLHGSAGYVSPTCLGYPATYNSGSWENWRNQYLAAGFAVMDINGYGESTENDQMSKPFGNPMAVETLYKAFQQIRKLYNVCDKLLLHGTSMGGTNAMSYLMNHSDTVAGVGLFAPALAPYYIHIIVPDKNYTGLDVATAWGYTDWTEMNSDGCSKLIGYSPMMEDDFNWVGSVITKTTYNNLTAKTRLPNVPIRIWHGTADTNVYYDQSTKLVQLLRKSNTPISLRTCSGGTHSISNGSVEYVCNEAVSWFKRFVN